MVIACFDETKPFMDRYANHATVYGLLVSVVGFMLTVGTVLETRRLNRRAQQKLQNQVEEARRETRELILKIRNRSMGDLCEQAYSFASEARYAIRSSNWLRAAERCQDARSHAQRLLSYPDLKDRERVQIRAAVEDLRSVVSLIEKNRLGPVLHERNATGKSRPVGLVARRVE